MYIASQGFQVVKRLFSTQVSCAENMLNLAWNQQLFKLGWYTTASMWNV